MVRVLIPALGRQNQADLCEFVASLVYRKRSSLARTTQRNCLEKKRLLIFGGWWDGSTIKSTGLAYTCNPCTAKGDRSLGSNSSMVYTEISRIIRATKKPYQKTNRKRLFFQKVQVLFLAPTWQLILTCNFFWPLVSTRQECGTQRTNMQARHLYTHSTRYGDTLPLILGGRST